MGFFSRLFSSDPQPTASEAGLDPTIADPDRRGSSVPADDSRNAPREGQGQISRGTEPPLSEAPSPPEHAHRELSMSDLHRTITEALDHIGIQYGQREDRDDVYLLERDGVRLMVGPLGVDGVPAAVSIFAVVLENVERTRELTVDLATRSGKTLADWATHDRADGTVTVTLSYMMSAEQLEVGLVERMVNSVLGTAVAEVDALQATYGGRRPIIFTGESPSLPTNMPTGPLTFSGRYPGYGPAQAMAAFLSVPGDGRPPYMEMGDYIWVFKGGGHELFDGDGYELVVGCCVEADGTPVIVVTGFCERKPEYAEKAAVLILGEKSALVQSAQSTETLGEDGLGEAAASGKLRQLRPSDVGPIQGFVGR